MAPPVRLSPFRRLSTKGGQAPLPTEGKAFDSPMDSVPDLYEAVERGNDAHQELIPLVNIRQPDDYSCGAVAALMILRYYGVGEQEIEPLKESLGTNREKSTHPFAIRHYLISVGLEVEDKEHMTLEDLAHYWELGWPVICPIQEYGDPTEEEKHPDADEEGKGPPAEFDYGHYVDFVGGPALGLIFVQDPSLENIMSGEQGDEARGLMPIPIVKWLRVWHDKDIHGKHFVRYGIAVGPPKGEKGEKGYQVVSTDSNSHLRRTPKSGGNIEGVQQVSDTMRPLWYGTGSGTNSYEMDEPGEREKAFKESNEEGWRCELPDNKSCEWGIFSAGAEDLGMELPGALTTIHDQTQWEEAHPDRWERSDEKAMEHPSRDSNPRPLLEPAPSQLELDEKGYSKPGLGNDFVFYLSAFNRWRTKPNVLGDRRINMAFERGKPADQLAIQNDEEFRITNDNKTKESQRYHATHPQIPAEAGYIAAEEEEEGVDAPRCPSGKPMSPVTRTCTETEGLTGGYPGKDEIHLESPDVHVGGQLAGNVGRDTLGYTPIRKSPFGKKSVYEQRCPNGDPFPIGSGTCGGRAADSWDGVVDKNNEAPWGNYPDYAEFTGLDTRPPDEREEPIVGRAVLIAKVRGGKELPVCPAGDVESPAIRSCSGDEGWKFCKIVITNVLPFSKSATHSNYVQIPKGEIWLHEDLPLEDAESELVKHLDSIVGDLKMR